MGMRDWFIQYLPSFVRTRFPEYTDADNPVIGVGVQTCYDAQTQTVYFCKKDYMPDDYVKYSKSSGFFIGTAPNHTLIKLGDSRYFRNASWTLSFNPQFNQGQGGWVSFHDWFPDLTMPAFSHFVTTKGSGFYRHNTNHNLFANHYDRQYPFEVDFPLSSGGSITTVRSAEYIAESWKYSNDGRDKFQVLDEGFDQAVLYNNEQCSGLLKLIPAPKNNPLLQLKYPITPKTDPAWTSILVDKQENKFRFNQFSDLVKDRGEFTGAALPLWNHGPNGYGKSLNPLALDYNKSPFERKKFRHYINRMLLIRNSNMTNQLLVKVFQLKINPSS
jgi:hypothetical protein